MTGALFHTEKDNARETVERQFSTSGAAYQVEGIDLEVERQDHRSLERFRRSGADEVEGHCRAGSLRNIGLQMANIAHQSFSMLTKYKFDDGWELGGQAVYRSKIYGGTFGANTGTELPSYWRFDAFVEKKIDKNWTVKLFVAEHDQQALLRHALPQRDAVRRGGAGARRSTWSPRRSSDAC